MGQRGSRIRRSPLAGVPEAAAERDAFAKARYHTLPRRFEDDYTIDRKHVLGTGMNGGVCLARRKGSSNKFAVKSFSLSNLRGKDLTRVRNETEIFLTMDHPNVAQLVDVYESEERLHFVMECMEGGELFARVVDQKKFAEDDAAAATLQMLLAINYMHSRGFVHRDVKLENFLYEQKGSDALKLIDFGFSIAWDSRCRPMTDKLGTAAYAAPEVLNGSYTSQCDLWSFGVIVFILLAGYMPFNKVEVDCIKQGRYCWRPASWANVSDLAVDFVKKLLTVDPAQRLTAAQALDHPWLARARATQERKQRQQFDQSKADALCSFSCRSLDSRLSSGLMAWSAPPSEHVNAREAFRMLDQKNTGVISQVDFIASLAQYGVSEQVSCRAFAALDVNGNGQLDYSEFLAAMIASRHQIDDDLLKRTQDELDQVIADPTQCNASKSSDSLPIGSMSKKLRVARKILDSLPVICDF
jgi:calcium-dependent protein kinase